jgi:hypothetical protein
VIRHVPLVLAVRVALAAEELSAHPVAVLPLDAIAYVIAPEPLLPVVDMLRTCEYGNDFEEVPSEFIVID